MTTGLLHVVSFDLAQMFMHQHEGQRWIDHASRCEPAHVYTDTGHISHINSYQTYRFRCFAFIRFAPPRNYSQSHQHLTPGRNGGRSLSTAAACLNIVLQTN